MQFRDAFRLALGASCGAIAAAGLAATAQAQEPIRVGIEAPWDLPYIPLSLAADRLKDQGVTLEPVLFQDPDAMALSLEQGDIDIASSGAASILAASDAGLDVRAFMGLTIPDFVLVAQADSPDCATLAGQRVGVHAQEDIFGTAIAEWVADKCPGTEFQTIVMPGSENRMAALLSDQLDATPIHLLPAVQLEKTNPGEFVIVEGFGFPAGVSNSYYYAKTDWLNENKETVAKIVDAYVQVMDEVKADPAPLVERSKELIPEVDPEVMTTVIGELIKMDFWNPVAGLEKSSFDATVGFLSDTIAFESPKEYEGVIMDVR